MINPKAVNVLGQLNKLCDEVMPSLELEYQQGIAGTIGALLLRIADEVESGVDRRVYRITKLKTLLRQGGEIVRDDNLTAKINTVCEAPIDDYRVSVLDELLKQCSGLMVELQAYLESEADPSYATLDREIWSFLYSESLS